MSHPINIETIRQRFQEKGLSLLTSEYTGNTQKLSFLCFCGRTDVTKWTHFSTAKDFGCWYCRHNIKGSNTEKIEKLRYLLNQVQVFPVEPLTFPEKESQFYVECACGETFLTRVKHLWRIPSGERYKCKKCLSKGLSLSLDRVEREFRTKGATPLFQALDYKNKESLLKFKCSCGREDFISVSVLRQTRSLVCSPCRLLRKRLSVEEVKVRFLERGLIPLFETYQDGKELLPCRTRCCNEIKYVSVANLPKKQNRTGKCISCQSEERRIPFSKVKEEFETKRGLKVLSPEGDYINAKSSLRIQCLCGVEIRRTYANTVFTGSSGLCESCQFSLTRPRGEKHGRFNPNLTEKERIGGDSQFSTWAKQVKKLHGGVCILTRSNSEKIVCHHLNGRHWKKRDQLYILNAAPLSDSLHKEFHSKYGYGKNTTGQFQEWIGSKGVDFDPIRILRKSSFYVRPLLLFLDLKNICSQMGIRIATTETPSLFVLKKGEIQKMLYVMSFRTSRREHLFSLKRKYPELLILSPLEMLLPEKREVLPIFLQEFLSESTLNTLPEGFATKPIPRQEIKKFMSENSLISYQGGGESFGLFLGGNLVAALTLFKKGSWRYVSNPVEKLGEKYKDSLKRICEHIIKVRNLKRLLFVQDRRFPEQFPDLFKVLKLGRPRKYYSRNSLVLKQVDVFLRKGVDSSVSAWAPELSLHENLILNGYSRVFDAGTLISVWRSRNECV